MTPSPSQVPVLLLVFNRPDKTRAVFELIREVKPARLFVAADGPRPARPQDAARCEETRKVIESVDWPCTVETLFHDRNLGCKRGVESGISWFFSKVDEGIILEDDCAPTSSFFGFCAELLERYRHTDEVGMIGGTNGLGEWKSDRQSYHFSHSYSIWGWASWRRAWDRYDPTMSKWADPVVRASIQQMLGDEQFRVCKQRLDDVYAGRIDTWDWAWVLALWADRALTAVPSVNLIRNIGFDGEATHTRNEWSEDANQRTHELTLPLTHPGSMIVDHEYDRLLFEKGRPVYSRLADLLPSGVQGPARAAFHKLTAVVPRRASR